jgi:hypothetical protein
LHRQLPRVLSQKTIWDGQATATRTPKQVYTLILNATNDVELAEKTEANFILSELRQGRTPQVD